MNVKQLSIPTEWDYLFKAVYAKQNYNFYYDRTVVGPVKIYGIMNDNYIKTYKALCLIDRDFTLETLYPTEEGEVCLRSDLLPFSERFFVPDLSGLGFNVPQELQEKLKELSKKSKPIT